MTPLRSITVSEPVALSLRALGDAGRAWLDGLPGLLASLEADWSITVGARLEGGTAAYVAEAVMGDGTPAVLKVLLPPRADDVTPFERQRAALRLACGDPYARLIRHDAARRALLLERLGRPMAALGRPADRQLAELARLAARGWRPVPDGLLPVVNAARWHAQFIPATWEELARPCPEAVVDLAVGCAVAREAAVDRSRAVLVHGDVHAFNALEAPGGGFRLVDPGGLVSEPAHDLGVILARGVRSWTDDLAARAPREARELMAGACQDVARLGGADPEAVRQWAVVELVSTGLLVLRLGRHEEARTFLAAAAAVA